MMLTEYDEKKVMEGFYKDGYEDGKAQGEARGLERAKTIFKLSLSGKTTAEIARECGISESEVQDILS